MATEAGARTAAQIEVEAVLGRLLFSPGTQWRAAAVICSHRREGDAEGDVSIANAIGMADSGAALDVVILVRRLRGLADELEEVIHGKRAIASSSGEPADAIVARLTAEANVVAAVRAIPTADLQAVASASEWSESWAAQLVKAAVALQET